MLNIWDMIVYETVCLKTYWKIFIFMNSFGMLEKHFVKFISQIFLKAIFLQVFCCDFEGFHWQ